MAESIKDAGTAAPWTAWSVSFVGQRVIVSLRRIVCQVLDKLPVVTIGVVAVNALAIGVVVRRRRISIPRRFETIAQGLDVVHLVSEVVYARNTNIGRPTFLRLNG